MSQANFNALQRYREYLSPENYQKLLASATQNAPLAVRVNLLKNPNPENALNDWQKRYGWQTELVPFWEPARQILHTETPASQTIEHRFGYYYIQDAASMLPVAIFSSIEEEQMVLDMAASPGGKTTQMLDRGLDDAFIMANDSSGSRLSALRVVTESWGMANGIISNYAGEKLGDWFPETFDRVLLDAPCSMESLRVSDSHPFRDISSSERKRLADRQISLLISALKACKTGGEVVYSTCTMAPEEDEAVVNALLELYPYAISIAKIENQDPASQGLIHFENQNYHPSLANSLRVWPFLFETNGFFAVKLIKTDSIETNPLQIPYRNFAQTGLTLLKPKEQEAILHQLQDRFGLDPQTLNNFEICQRATQLQLVPKSYLQHFQTLPYNTLGLSLGKLIKSKLEPSFEFVNRFGLQFNRNVWQLPTEYTKTWIQGQDLRGIALSKDCDPGIIAIKNENGILIGAGKWSVQRLRNLLPHRYLL